MINKRLAIADFKAHLAEALREVEAGGRIVVERRGRPVAVLVAPEAAGLDDRGWWHELHGVARDIDDFEAIMRNVVRSRRKARSRPIDLEA
jgi:prevent-host-death family protein